MAMNQFKVESYNPTILFVFRKRQHRCKRDISDITNVVNFQLLKGIAFSGTYFCRNHRIIESLRLERPLKSPSPTVNPSPPCLLNHIMKCNSYKFF